MISIYATFPDRKSAERIARKLVEARLIACANIFPCTSIYIWKGKMQKHDEHVMIAKCADRKRKEAEALLLKLHPYDVPAIVWHAERASGKYAQWVDKSTR